MTDSICVLVLSFAVILNSVSVIVLARRLRVMWEDFWLNSMK